MNDGATPFLTEPLGDHHDRAAFSCGVKALDDYLRRQAGQDQRRNVSRTFVLTGDKPADVAGYYTLSSFAIDLGEIPDDLARRLPRHPEVPAALIGRLAVAVGYQGRGLGALILLDALRRIAEQSTSIGIYAIVVDAIDDQAAAFYEKYDFIRFPSRPDRLFLPVATAKQLFE